MGEAVLIQQERGKHMLMYSRAEFSNCSLPRLQTRMGEAYLKDIEKEINDEKNMEEVRDLRRKKNGARLSRGLEVDRRRKTCEGSYILVDRIQEIKTRG